MDYLFQLGNHPNISATEIRMVFSLWDIPYSTVFQDKQYLIVESKDELDFEKMMERLGGVIKIGKKLKNTVGLKLHTEDISDQIVAYLAQQIRDGKILFSVSEKIDKRLSVVVKKKLKEQGRSTRFIQPKNTATILHNKLIILQTDLTVVKDDSGNYHIFTTHAVQPIEMFSKRDYGRPKRDIKSGMLPPKLARIMINLAELKQHAVLLDPFCGSGTILMEAALMGYTGLIGSDVSPKAMSGTLHNLEWAKDTYHLSHMDFTLHIHAAADLHSVVDPKSIDAIITEPYLGLPLKGHETQNQLEKQATGLKKLYINAFKSFHKILKRNGIVIFIIPQFRYNNDWITVDCINEIKKIGFNVVPFGEDNTSLLYWRHNQWVGRNIWKFKKKA